MVQDEGREKLCARSVFDIWNNIILLNTASSELWTNRNGAEGAV